MQPQRWTDARCIKRRVFVFLFSHTTVQMYVQFYYYRRHNSLQFWFMCSAHDDDDDISNTICAVCAHDIVLIDTLQLEWGYTLPSLCVNLIFIFAYADGINRQASTQSRKWQIHVHICFVSASAIRLQFTVICTQTHTHTHYTSDQSRNHIHIPARW